MKHAKKHIIYISAPDYDLILTSKKEFNNQRDDHAIRVGDMLHIHELAPSVDGKPGHATGKNCFRRVKNKEVGTAFLAPGCCTLEIEKL